MVLLKSSASDSEKGCHFIKGAASGGPEEQLRLSMWEEEALRRQAQAENENISVH
jgi:hypothetical protein